MFSSLTEKLSDALRKVSGKSNISEKNISDTLHEIKKALIDADVAISVVDNLLKSIKEKALGAEVIKHVSPGQAFIKIVQEQLTEILGAENSGLNLDTKPPAVVLLAGLQGSGKTTFAGKLALHLKNTTKKRVMLASADVYRPAAIAQLKLLAEKVGAMFLDTDEQEPNGIAKLALLQAKKQSADVLIFDTAGRLHIDDKMMAEIKSLHKILVPAETLFVVDSMTGQDAANTASSFNQALSLTGVVATKTDGDARGGAILSIREITQKPIKFVGTGEKIEDLELFHPERFASRILGMGDVLSLVEEMEQKVDKEKADKLAKKLEKGKGFDLEDFKQQLIQMQNMGGIGSIMDKMPGLSALPPQAKKLMNDKLTSNMLALINSMTMKERKYPSLIKGRRKMRIIKGSGRNMADLNKLLKQHAQMKKMFGKFKNGGMNKMLQSLKGKLPPGFPG